LDSLVASDLDHLWRAELTLRGGLHVGYHVEAVLQLLCFAFAADLATAVAFHPQHTTLVAPDVMGAT
jgi:uncharacterized membrane protein